MTWATRIVFSGKQLYIANTCIYIKIISKNQNAFQPIISMSYCLWKSDQIHFLSIFLTLFKKNLKENWNAFVLLSGFMYNGEFFFVLCCSSDTIIQTTDINATPTAQWYSGNCWNPIGTFRNPFTGVLFSSDGLRWTKGGTTHPPRSLESITLTCSNLVAVGIVD